MFIFEDTSGLKVHFVHKITNATNTKTMLVVNNNYDLLQFRLVIVLGSSPF